MSTTVQDSEKRSFTYSYAVSAGKIEGEGSSVLWDLTSAGFGEHTVKVLVGNAKHERATASLTVSIVECGICDAPRDLCPTISVECPSEVERGKVITFVATVTSFGKPNTTYSWATDAGRIVEGRYEKKMTLDLLRFPFEKVTATVTVGGYDPSCPTSASCTTKIRE